MSVDTVVIVGFVAAFVVPALIFSIATAAGVSPLRLCGTMVIFWTLLLTSAVLASTALAAEGRDRIARDVLLADTLVTALLILPRFMGFREARRRHDKVPKDLSASVPAKGSCQLKIVNEGGGTLPVDVDGEAGRIGWYCLLANYYSWKFHLESTASGSQRIGMASASGEFAPWYSARKGPYNAVATVAATVLCDDRGTECVADGAGGQDHSSDGDFSAAVVIKATAKDAVAVLEVELAAAVAGQIAVKSISAGGVIAGVTVGPVLELPHTARDAKKVVRTYTYQCRR